MLNIQARLYAIGGCLPAEERSPWEVRRKIVSVMFCMSDLGKWKAISLKVASVDVALMMSILCTSIFRYLNILSTNPICNSGMGELVDFLSVQLSVTFLLNTARKLMDVRCIICSYLSNYDRSCKSKEQFCHVTADRKIKSTTLFFHRMPVVEYGNLTSRFQTL